MKELTLEELQIVDGGINWDRVFAGAAFIGATTLAIALAPVGGVGLAAAGVAFGCDLVGTAYGAYGFAS